MNGFLKVDDLPVAMNMAGTIGITEVNQGWIN